MVNKNIVSHNYPLKLYQFYFLRPQFFFNLSDDFSGSLIISFRSDIVMTGILFTNVNKIIYIYDFLENNFI